ncbi:hypothetical protein Emed_006910 [Eimeria media]
MFWAVLFMEVVSALVIGMITPLPGAPADEMKPTGPPEAPVPGVPEAGPLAPEVGSSCTMSGRTWGQARAASQLEGGGKREKPLPKEPTGPTGVPAEEPKVPSEAPKAEPSPPETPLPKEPTGSTGVPAEEPTVPSEAPKAEPSPPEPVKLRALELSDVDSNAKTMGDEIFKRVSDSLTAWAREAPVSRGQLVPIWTLEKKTFEQSVVRNGVTYTLSAKYLRAPSTTATEKMADLLLKGVPKLFEECTPEEQALMLRTRTVRREALFGDTTTGTILVYLKMKGDGR